MEQFTKFFLRAKHWHLFLLIIVSPLIFQILMMVVMVSGMGGQSQTNPSVMLSVFPVLMIIVVGIFFGWVWSVAIGLQTKIPNHIKMKTNKFRLLFFIPLVYIFLISSSLFVVPKLGPAVSVNGAEPGTGPVIGVAIFLFLTLHLFSMFCIFYSLYFAAKTLKTAELQRETTFSDFAGEFFLFWFYPIGIWIVQPRINQIAGSTPTIS